MRSWHRSLRTRLLASFLLVVLVVAGIGYAVIRLITPTLFESRLRARGGASAGNGRASDASGEPGLDLAPIEDAYAEALSVAAVSAAVAGTVVAMIVAWLLIRMLLGRLDEVQRAAARLAEGQYDTVVPEPPEVELAGLASSINSLGQALSSTEEKRARLMSDLAHELRNPLTTIEGYMEGLIDGVLPATSDTFVAVAEEAARLKRLTADLSLLARAQESSLHLAVDSTDLADLTRGAFDTLRPQYESKGVVLEVDLRMALPIRGDRDRLTQAITNVAGNALTHTPAGGVVKASGGCDEHTCWVEVRDTGSGIPEEQIATIFERFTRLDSEGTGIGIGLNIARTILRAHGGEISARSAGEGTGTAFTLCVPASFT